MKINFSMKCNPLAACGNGTLASYIANPCNLSESSIVFLPGYSIGPLQPSDIIIKLDIGTDGLPDPHTLLIKSAKFAVTAGQKLFIKLPLRVTNANGMNAWLHKCVVTGDARIDANQKTGSTVSAVFATTGSPPDPQQGGVVIPNAGKSFLSEINIVLNGGLTGTASFTSFGIHYGLR